MTSDCYNVQRMFLVFLRGGVRAPILLLGSIILSFTIQPVFGIVLLSLTPIVLLILINISKKSGSMGFNPIFIYFWRLSLFF